VETGHDSTTVSTVDTIYAQFGCSPLGQVSKVSQPYAPGQTPVYTVYTYDGSGRTLTATAPDGVSTTTNQYWGNSVSVFDATGKVKANTRDVFGNIIQMTEIDPNNSANYLFTYYTYNPTNQLVGVTMPRSNGTQTRTFVWNTTDLVGTTNPENGTVLYTYDAAHRVTSRTDAKGQKTQYTYDPYGRPSRVDYYPTGATQPDACQTVNLAYDFTQLPEYDYGYGLGRISSATWSGTDAVRCPNGFAERYTYTIGGHVAHKQLRMTATGALPVNVEGYFTFDGEGHLASTQVPANSGTFDYREYVLDAWGRPTVLRYYPNGLGATPTNLVWGASYSAAEQLTQMTYGYNYTETRTYNANLQLTNITNSVLGVNLDYRYGDPNTAANNNGRVRQVKDNVSGEEVTYTYDSLNRLTQAATTDATWGQSFGYDGFGNLLSEQGVAGKGAAPMFNLTVDANNHITTTGYAYDANGNLTQTPTGSYAYDVANRLIGNNIYNLANQRIFDGVYLYYYGIRGELLAKYQPLFGAQQSQAYLQGTDNLYFAGRAVGNGGQWVTTDRIGSVRADGSGTHRNFYPYGTEITSK
jgi:YD repeat-containing protein